MLNELQNSGLNLLQKIKIENNASRKLFESAGYEPVYLIMKRKRNNSLQFYQTKYYIPNLQDSQKPIIVYYRI